MVDVHEMLGRLPLDLSELHSYIYEKMLADQATSGKFIIQTAFKTAIVYMYAV